MKGRPARISFKQWNDKKREVEVVERQARFHCWGVRKPKKEDNPKIVYSETVGVCELDDGQVRLVQPEKIQFLDKSTPQGEANATVSR